MIRFYSCSKCKKKFSLIEGTGDDPKKECPFCSNNELRFLRTSKDTRKHKPVLKHVDVLPLPPMDGMT